MCLIGCTRGYTPPDNGGAEGKIDRPSPELAIIVVNFASSDLLATNLVSVSTECAAAATIVVDNFSTDHERSAVRKLADAHGWTIVEPTGNVGFGEGMNLGAARAIALGANKLLLLNPDATISASSINALADKVTADPRLLAAPVVLRPDGGIWSSGSDLHLHDGRIRATRRRGDASASSVMTWLSGACLMVSTSLWKTIDGFDDHYFLYWEDVDLSWKVHAAGGRLQVVDEATAVHAEGGTQITGTHRRSGDRKSNTYYYYNVRNRLVFAALRLAETDADYWMKNRRQVAWEILLQGGRRQFLRTLAPFWAAHRGLRDGVAMTASIGRERAEETTT